MRTDYDAVLLALEKRYSNNYSVRVSYTWARSTGNTSGAGVPASGFQVLDDMNLDLNEGVTAQDIPNNLVVSGMARVPRTGGLTVSWVARALSGTPFSLTNGTLDPDLNGSLSEPLAAGTYSGTGADAYTVDGYRSERNGARGPGFFKLDMRDWLQHQPDGSAARDLRRDLQRHQPGELREPRRESGQHQLSAADRILDQHDAADGAVRGALRLLNAAGHLAELDRSLSRSGSASRLLSMDAVRGFASRMHRNAHES